MKAPEAFEKMVTELKAMQQDQIHNILNKYAGIVSEKLKEKPQPKYRGPQGY